MDVSMTDRRWSKFPFSGKNSEATTITLEQMKGFSLFMRQAVLNGCGYELLDLAGTHLFR